MDGNLILGRRVGESVVIDGDIVVTVVKASAGRVALSFQAPDDVGIWRQEITDPATGFPPEGGDHVPG